MLNQVANGGSITHYINQVTAGTVDRQKREQRKKGYYTPNGLISSYMSDNPFQLLQVFYRILKLIPAIFIILEQVKTRASRRQLYRVSPLGYFIGNLNCFRHGIGLNQKVYYIPKCFLDLGVV